MRGRRSTLAVSSLLPSKTNGRCCRSTNARPMTPFLRQLNASGKKWVIIVDPSGRPSFVLDAHHFLRDLIFDTMSAGPEFYWHRPVIVTDMSTPLGGVIGRMKVK